MHIDSLYSKMRLLIDVFGVPELQKGAKVHAATTISRWGTLTKVPRGEHIDNLCEYLNITKEEFCGTKDKFISAIAKGKDKKEEDLAGYWIDINAICTPFLRRTLNMEAHEKLSMFYKMLKGYYYGYCYWKDMTKKPNQNIIVKFLLEIYNYDKSFNVLNVRMLGNKLELLRKHSLNWDYEGQAICYGGKMVIIFEKVITTPEIVWLLANIPDTDSPDTDSQDIYGILSAGIKKTVSIRSIPAATRVLLKKVDQTLPLEEMQNQASRELSSGDIDPDILNLISNRIDSDIDILTIPT